MTNTIRTYSDALEAGYKQGRTAWTRGYVSRKADTGAQPIHTTRGGELYVLLPSWQSTRYCVRQYLYI